MDKDCLIRLIYEFNLPDVGCSGPRTGHALESLCRYRTVDGKKQAIAIVRLCHTGKTTLMRQLTAARLSSKIGELAGTFEIPVVRQVSRMSWVF